ncbi:MAG: hypothetical protein QNI89_12635 [Desulfobacterales bacterium]|nr:hypothetical protein [Desulfobacterales bacterium]MDJ0854694.1 hypothetical protein [Desulfobacterales bacterium]MDJ0888148.1 hypothetical protein [Desulfobacterales bacterium]MDJ0989252.1 hypothetical protein [Desulfobacterales bacterium]
MPSGLVGDGTCLLIDAHHAAEGVKPKGVNAVEFAPGVKRSEAIRFRVVARGDDHLALILHQMGSGQIDASGSTQIDVAENQLRVAIETQKIERLAEIAEKRKAAIGLIAKVLFEDFANHPVILHDENMGFLRIGDDLRHRLLQRPGPGPVEWVDASILQGKQKACKPILRDFSKKKQDSAPILAELVYTLGNRIPTWKRKSTGKQRFRQ